MKSRIGIEGCQLTTSTTRHGVAVDIVGEIDISNASAVQEALVATLATSRALTLDLGGVTFVDSSGLSALIRVAVAARATGATFVARRPGRNTERLMKFAGVSEFLLGDSPERVDCDRPPPTRLARECTECAEPCAFERCTACQKRHNDQLRSQHAGVVKELFSRR